MRIRIHSPEENKIYLLTSVSGDEGGGDEVLGVWLDLLPSQGAPHSLREELNSRLKVEHNPT